ncbi:hypothetical protein [Salinispora tropica]|uniref:Uncharacterized protein n=1 Tax=Salinispora tropica (strain ATCC BAA-916 / DSM 44818 / JCM 13857 / NBRC 105044 / CNB-440) TaxID=369723 RepID=A4X5I1_SALTO|nr:hypothetical protein [Salinispora tropica]ABP54131.1 hypothetical protein Strop_1667 [Salinispora tropica CNB-440]
MAETFADQDLATLRSIARGAGIADTERMPHDELVEMLRRAGLAEPDSGAADQPTRDPAGLSDMPRSDLTLGDESTGGRAAEESIGARPGESGTEIPDRSER